MIINHPRATIAQTNTTTAETTSAVQVEACCGVTKVTPENDAEALERNPNISANAQANIAKNFFIIRKVKKYGAPIWDKKKPHKI